MDAREDFAARVERKRSDFTARIERVQFLLEEAERMRVMWQKAENMFSAFFAELENLRPRITDELLADWCFWNLSMSVDRISRTSNLLAEADAERTRVALKKARDLEKERSAAERARLAAEKAAQYAVEEEARRLREADKAAEAAEAERRAALATARVRGRSRVTPELLAEAKARLMTGAPLLEDALAREFGCTRHVVQGAADQARGEIRAEARHAGVVPEEPPKKRQKKVSAGQRDSRDVLAEMSSPQQPVPRAGLAESAPDLKDLAIEIRAALARISRVRGVWIEATLELADKLRQARERLRGNGNFSEWLKTNNIELSVQNRAALIGLGRDLAATRAALETAKSWSWQLIWEEMSHLSNARKMADAEALPQILH